MINYNTLDFYNECRSEVVMFLLMLSVLANIIFSNSRIKLNQKPVDENIDMLKSKHAHKVHDKPNKCIM